MAQPKLTRPPEIRDFTHGLYQACAAAFAGSDALQEWFTAFRWTRDNYISAPVIGHEGLFYRYRVQRSATSVELYFDTGDAARNAAVFDGLYNQKDAIEKALGDALEWRSHTGNAAKPMQIRRIVWVYSEGGGYTRDKSTWPSTYTALVERIILFDRVMRQWLAQTA